MTDPNLRPNRDAPDARRLRVLGVRRSINVRKVLWACDEIGLPYVQEDWGGGARSTSDPEFRALNPKGLVPVVIDGEAVVTESNTILRYLAAKHRREDLLPSEPLARARVEEVMDWQATEFNSAWRLAFRVLARGDRSAANEAQVAHSLAAWNESVALVELRLARGGRYVCGEAFTVADIVIGLSVNRWLRAPIERPSLPKVEAYLHRLRRRGAALLHLGDGTD